MSDLSEQLREALTVLDEPAHYSKIAKVMSKSANALEQAQARIKKLEGALRSITNTAVSDWYGDEKDYAAYYKEVARNTLAELEADKK